MSKHEIDAVNKPHRHSPHEHITHIGNNAGDWKITRESAITRIKSGQDEFYTVDKTSGNRKEVPIEVVQETGKAPYLRTKADGKWSDNLLALPECTGKLVN